MNVHYFFFLENYASTGVWRTCRSAEAFFQCSRRLRRDILAFGNADTVAGLVTRRPNPVAYYGVLTTILQRDLVRRVQRSVGVSRDNVSTSVDQMRELDSTSWDFLHGILKRDENSERSGKVGRSPGRPQMLAYRLQATNEKSPAKYLPSRCVLLYFIQSTSKPLTRFAGVGRNI